MKQKLRSEEGKRIYERVGFQAMRLGTVIYFLPFFFVLDPALVAQAAAYQIVIFTVTALLGVALLSQALEGHMFRLGRSNPVIRSLFLSSGFLLFIPGWQTDLMGLALIPVSVLINWLMAPKLSASQAKRETGSTDNTEK
jgi:TRAP-type uncharacterized transport system fused permease subunit